MNEEREIRVYNSRGDYLGTFEEFFDTENEDKEET